MTEAAMRHIFMHGYLAGVAHSRLDVDPDDLTPEQREEIYKLGDEAFRMYLGLMRKKLQRKPESGSRFVVEYDDED